MTQNNDYTLCKRLLSHMGAETILTALPQQQVRRALGLVSVSELAASLGVRYGTLRSRMNSGQIPFPEFRLKRRAFYTQEQAEAIRRAWNDGQRNALPR